ncbi:MAG: hypothetical protein FD133_707 [Erysipelotrichaceae bacterium]|nr:MAG: hypothetical protein FD179_1344 [Erysipelotrichaceae bacterium]TXT18664.1 MAG: hypothetical protein FD133_707 [Erysipelotrichaceae bacterium]
MKTKTKLIALIGVAALGAYTADKIKRTQDLKPVIIVPLPDSKSVLLKVNFKNSLTNAMIASYKAQITEMTNTLDPKDDIILVHHVSNNEQQAHYLDDLMSAVGYTEESGPNRTKYKKTVKAEAQTIFDEVLYTAQTAKSLKQEYLGWDFSK